MPTKRGNRLPNINGFKLTNLEEDPKIVRELIERGENALLYKLLDVKKDVSPLLDQIKITFPEFTSHDVAHSERVLEKLDLLIPDALMRKMNKYEIYFLIVSAYLHDTGMAVFPKFKELELFKFDDEIDKQTEEQKEKTQNFIRENHHERSEEICKRIFSDLLGDEHQAEIIGRICRGHRKDNLNDTSLFNSKKMYRNKPINVPLMASFIRNGDELDLTFERVPWIVYENVPLKNTISKEEWNKHFSIGGVGLDPEDHLTIRCSATCKNLKIHRSLKNLETKIELELRDLPTYLNHYREFTSFIPRTFVMDIVPEGYDEKLDSEEENTSEETHDGDKNNYECLFDKPVVLTLNKEQVFPKVTIEKKVKQKTDESTIVNIELKINLTLIQTDFDSLRIVIENKNINRDLKYELDMIQENLDELNVYSEKETLEKPFNKLYRFLEKLSDPTSDYNQMIIRTQKGIEQAQKVRRTYNKFAQWLAMPQVPDLFLGKQE